MRLITLPLIFLGMASVGLAIEFYKDVTTLTVDSRRAWFMQGAGIALVIAANVSLAYFIGLALIIIVNHVFSIIEKRQKKILFADGDKEIMRWLFPALYAFFSIGSIGFLAGLCVFLFIGTRAKKFLGLRKLPGLLSICAGFVVAIPLFI